MIVIGVTVLEMEESVKMDRKRRKMCVMVAFATVLLAGLLLAPARADSIVAVSIPENSMDGGCRPWSDGVWSASAPPYPLDIATGIGYLINPSYHIGDPYYDLVLHDNGYVGSYVPDPTQSIITYAFDEAVVVDQIEIIQHTNGITQIEGFVGNSLASMSSVGSVFGPSGDVTGVGALPEGGSQVFDFDNSTAGMYFQVVVTKTPLEGAYAIYRMFPSDMEGSRCYEAARESNDVAIPEPATLSLMGICLAGCVAAVRRRRKK